MATQQEQASRQVAEESREAEWRGSSYFGFMEYGPLARHMRFAARASRRLARSIFHGMLRFGPKLERKQAFLFRAVDVALELFALSASLRRALSLPDDQGAGARLLAEQFARSARRRIDAGLHEMWHNDDALKLDVASSVLAGQQIWLEHGSIGLPFTIEQMRPETMEQYFASRQRTRPAQPGQSARTGTGARRG
jgi:hypothetical protein